jgi:hypothetical protein
MKRLADAVLTLISTVLLAGTVAYGVLRLYTK